MHESHRCLWKPKSLHLRLKPCRLSSRKPSLSSRESRLGAWESRRSWKSRTAESILVKVRSLLEPCLLDSHSKRLLGRKLIKSLWLGLESELVLTLPVLAPAIIFIKVMMLRFKFKICKLLVFELLILFQIRKIEKLRSLCPCILFCRLLKLSWFLKIIKVLTNLFLNHRLYDRRHRS